MPVAREARRVRLVWACPELRPFHGTVFWLDDRARQRVSEPFGMNLRRRLPVGDQTTHGAEVAEISACFESRQQFSDEELPIVVREESSPGKAIRDRTRVEVHRSSEEPPNDRRGLSERVFRGRPRQAHGLTIPSAKQDVATLQKRFHPRR